MNHSALTLSKRLCSCILQKSQRQLTKSQPCSFSTSAKRSIPTNSGWASKPGPTPLPFLSRRALRTRRVLVVSVTALCVAPLGTSTRFYSVEKKSACNESDIVDRDKSGASDTEKYAKERGIAPKTSTGNLNYETFNTKTQCEEIVDWKVISPMELRYPRTMASRTEVEMAEKWKAVRRTDETSRMQGFQKATEAKGGMLEAPWEVEAASQSQKNATTENDQRTVGNALSPAQLMSKSLLKESISKEVPNKNVETGTTDTKVMNVSEASRKSSFDPSLNETVGPVAKHSENASNIDSTATSFFGQEGSPKGKLNSMVLKSPNSMWKDQSPLERVPPDASTSTNGEKEKPRSRESTPEQRPQVIHAPNAPVIVHTLAKNATKRNAAILSTATLEGTMKARHADKTNSKNELRAAERSVKKKSVMQVTADYFSSIGATMEKPSFPFPLPGERKRLKESTLASGVKIPGSSLTDSPYKKPIGLPVRETLAINASEVHIAALPWDYTEEDVANLCARFGGVFHCHMETDREGFRTGSALVTMENARAALLAVEGLQNMVVEESFRLRVAISNKILSPLPAVRGTRNVIRVEPLPPNISTRELAEHVAAYGTVLACSIPKVDGMSANYGLVAMLAEEDARKAIRKLHRTRFQTSTIKLTMLSPTSNGNFPLRTISIRSGRIPEKIYLDRLLVTEDVTLEEAMEIARLPKVTQQSRTRLVARTEYGDRVPFRRPLARLVTDQRHLDVFLSIEKELPFDWNSL